MVDPEKVCVLVPTYNEAETIAEVIERFHAEGYENVLVIDGGSEDGTQERAAEVGARVVEQTSTGKGQAVREAVELISEPYVLLMDGDATYRPEQHEAMLEPLFSGEAEHVIGNRFADMEPGAMSRLNQFGNRVINRAFRFIHGRNLRDILSGYRAFTRSSFERLSLSADGFGIETEMAVECVRQDVRTAVVPITYEARPEDSETNLRPFRDGAVIILTLYQMARKNNPIFYFGSIGVSSMGVGAVLAVFVLYRFLVHGISHEVIALASGVTILFGVQLVMFGVLSDLIVTANREQSRKLDRLTERLEERQTTAGGPASSGGHGANETPERDEDADGTAREDTTRTTADDATPTATDGETVAETPDG